MTEHDLVYAFMVYALALIAALEANQYIFIQDMRERKK